MATTRLLPDPPPRMLALPMNMNRRSFVQGSLTVAAAAGATWFDVPNILAATAKPSKAAAKIAAAEKEAELSLIHI